MKNTIVGLAIIKANWDKNKKDYLENFVNFVVHLIVSKKIKEITAQGISEEFEKEWGLRIPYYPMVSILNRVKTRGFIRKEQGKFHAVEERIKENDFLKISAEQNRKWEKVVSEFVGYCKNKYESTISNEDAEQIFIAYLKKHDLDILFLSERQTVLPDVKASKERLFLMNTFIRDAYLGDPLIFDFIVSIAVGHLLASSLLLYYDESNISIRLSGQLRDIKFYLDANIVFSLLGIEGKYRKENCIEFLKSIRNEGSGLFIFEHTYEEVTVILNNCLRIISSKTYDPSKASRALVYFFENGFSESDVELFINNIRSVVEEYGIAKVQIPDKNENRQYQIDEKELYRIIVDNYSIPQYTYLEHEKERTIRKDIDSLSGIYALRKGFRPRAISNATHIFVTSNSSLALCSKIYDKSFEAEDGFAVPVCVTDVFLGTLLWLQSYNRVTSINRTKIISDTYAALQPDAALIKTFVTEVEKLRETDKISQTEYLLLRTTRVARELLEEKTLGDVDNFTPATAQEILREMEAESIKKGRLQYKDEVEARLTKRLNGISDVSSNILYIILILLFILACVDGYFGNILPDKFWAKLVSVVSLITVIILGYFGFDKIRGWLKSSLFRLLKKVLEYFLKEK
jgi:hypothetical protein